MGDPFEIVQARFACVEPPQVGFEVSDRVLQEENPRQLDYGIGQAPSPSEAMHFGEKVSALLSNDLSRRYRAAKKTQDKLDVELVPQAVSSRDRSSVPTSEFSPTLLSKLVDCSTGFVGLGRGCRHNQPISR